MKRYRKKEREDAFTHVTVAVLFGELLEVCVHRVPGVGWIGIPPLYVDVSFRNETQLHNRKT